MKRAVAYDEGNFGLWAITCATCPLKPHAKALGQRTPDCAAGIATNMQGPIPTKVCKHTNTESLRNEADNGLSIECRYGDDASGANDKE
jgi:hypothetical protein